MSVTYQPEVIEQYAEKMYLQANLLMIKYALGLGLLLGAGGMILALSVKELQRGASPIAIAGLVAGCIAGGIIGYAKSFELRLKAQLALCQLQVEKNTRHHAAPAPATHAPAHHAVVPIPAPRAS
jgi:hypothetical protein